MAKISLREPAHISIPRALVSAQEGQDIHLAMELCVLADGTQFPDQHQEGVDSAMEKALDWLKVFTGEKSIFIRENIEQRRWEAAQNGEIPVH